MPSEVIAPEMGDIAKIAILFDAENISYQLVEEAIAIAKPYGKPILRAYGDFSKPHVKGWEEPALNMVFAPFINLVTVLRIVVVTF